MATVEVFMGGKGEAGATVLGWGGNGFSARRSAGWERDVSLVLILRFNGKTGVSLRAWFFKESIGVKGGGGEISRDFRIQKNACVSGLIKSRLGSQKEKHPNQPRHRIRSAIPCPRQGHQPAHGLLLLGLVLLHALLALRLARAQNLLAPDLALVLLAVELALVPLEALDAAAAVFVTTEQVGLGDVDHAGGVRLGGGEGAVAIRPFALLLHHSILGAGLGAWCELVQTLFLLLAIEKAVMTEELVALVEVFVCLFYWAIQISTASYARRLKYIFESLGCMLGKTYLAEAPGLVGWVWQARVFSLPWSKCSHLGEPDQQRRHHCRRLHHSDVLRLMAHVEEPFASRKQQMLLLFEV